MMNLVSDEKGFTFTRESGEEVKFSYKEVNFIEHELTKNNWRNGIDEQIDYDEENIDFTEHSRDELINWCVDELESKFENSYDFGEPDYAEILFDIAQDNGMWKE